jgi:hypothetical protein
MNQITKHEDNVLSALKKSMPVSVTSHSRDMTIIPKVDVGWDKIRVAPNKNFATKPVEEWNKHDLRYYVNNEFFRKVGSPYPGAQACAAAMAVFADLECKLRTRMQQDCTITTIKSYIDYFYEKHLFDAMKRWKISYNTLGYDCFVNDYVIFAQNQKQLSAMVTTELPHSILSLSDLEKASKIGRVYFVAKYGIAVLYNYLLATKSQSPEQAKAFVTDAAKRSKSASELNIAIEATKKFDYPDWFDLDIVDEVLISVGAEPLKLKPVATEKFSFLRSVK